MTVAKRVYVSLPSDEWLSTKDNALKWALVGKIEKAGYIAEVFSDPRGSDTLAGGKAWSREAADTVARRCIGAAFLGFPRWTFDSPRGPVKLATEFSQYEGGLAHTLGLPMLVVAQDGLMRRVQFDQASGNFIGRIPDDAGPEWADSPQFSAVFAPWKRELDRRRGVFLGYCSSSTGIAHNIRRYLEKELEVSVLDWSRDFRPGRSILQEIEDARRLCSGGVFLFTRDDDVASPDPDRLATPRDNVVFESGYFASARGSDRTLIILESGTKLPADLGGTIYLPLPDRTNIQLLEQPIARFIESL